MERRAEMVVEHVPSSGEFDLKAHVEWQLQMLGLAPSDLANKTILDVGAGDRYVERYVKEQKIPSTVVSLDLGMDPIDEHTTGNGVVTDMFDGLPFKDNSFDLLINAGGPLSGSPYDEEGMRNYRDGMRVLKSGGELRVTNPYKDIYDQKGGIPTRLQELALEGKLSVDQEEVDRHTELELKEARMLGYNKEDRHTLLQSILFKGLPTSHIFWTDYLERSIPKNEQETLCVEFTTKLQQEFDASHVPTRTTLYDPTPKAESFIPTLVVKKL